MLETPFKKELCDEIERRFPGCMILRNDPRYLQGVPDILVLYKGKWAALETKRSANAKIQPNQEYYVDKMNDMSYAAFVYPENRDEVLNAMGYMFIRRR